MSSNQLYTTLSHLGFERRGGRVNNDLDVEPWLDRLDKIIYVRGVSLLSHLDGRVPVVFAPNPKKLTIVINI